MTEIHRTERSPEELNNDVMTLLPHVQTALRLTDRQARRLHERLWRFSTHIRQPRKDVGSCNKTPFFDRWDRNPETSHLTPKDPRYASEEECTAAYKVLLASLLEAHAIPEPPSCAITLAAQMLGRPFRPQTLSCTHTGRAISGDDIKSALNYCTAGLGAYEVPTSYHMELSDGGRHERTNVGWMKPVHAIYALRKALRSHLADFRVPKGAIKTALDKISVKAYCTDKQTMPPHFSNRDVRWATWPASAQYASHYECAMIELELLAQLYEFGDAPQLDGHLTSAIEEVSGQPLSPGTRRCFVMGRRLRFPEFVEAAINPRGGRSVYHVGHVVPLTRGGKHEWGNIGWMSDDGNRIQGNDLLEEIEAKLADAVEYHLRRDMEMDRPSGEFCARARKLSRLLKEIRERFGID